MRTIARGLAVAAVVLFSVALGAAPASAGGGCHGPLTDAAAVHVEIAALCFTPTVIRVRAGTTVDWVNRDSVEHTVSATGDAFDADLQDGQAYRRRFDQSGVFPYYCHLHPGMVGVVMVDDGRVAGESAGAEAGTTTTALAVAAGPVARSGHHSVWPEVGIGALILVAAAGVSLGAWRSMQTRRLRTVPSSRPLG